MCKTWKIYVHQNLTNGKLYIGQTSEDNVKRRWRGGSSYKRCLYFYNAIQKYGWDGFRHFVLINNIKTQEEANLIEEFLIKKYHTTDKNFGYNLQSGGNARLQSESTKEKIRQYHINQHEEKSEVIMVKQQFNQIKDRIGELKVAPLSSKNESRATYKYICIETQKVYNSSIQAEKDTGISARAIRSVCSGQQKSTHNTHWDYYEDGKEYNLKDYIIKRKTTRPKAKKVYCHELNITFNSGNEAAKYLGMASPNHIFECCDHIRATCQGYHWSYPKEVVR